VSFLNHPILGISPSLTSSNSTVSDGIRGMAAVKPHTLVVGGNSRGPGIKAKGVITPAGLARATRADANLDLGHLANSSIVLGLLVSMALGEETFVFHDRLEIFFVVSEFHRVNALVELARDVNQVSAAALGGTGANMGHCACLGAVNVVLEGAGRAGNAGAGEQ
jgi:hypothetical protein